MSLASPNSSNPYGYRFLAIIFCYFALQTILRVGLSTTLDYDEAEQALLSQWLLPGYTEQPPLYTWLQYALFRLLGPGVLAVSLLKNALLFATYAFVFSSARLVTKDIRLSILASCSLLLIPQIAWESQRDMTHTTLVVFAAAATLYFVLRLLERPNITGYLLFGLAMGIGFLGKANYGLFLAAIITALVFTRSGRALLFDYRILLALALMLLLSSRYFLWMYANQDIVFISSHKFKQAVTGYYIKGPVSLVRNATLFLTPLLLFYLIIFPQGFFRAAPRKRSTEQRLLQNYIFAVFALLLLVVLLFKVSYVKDRWLQPLLFAFPIFFFARLDAKGISAARFRGFCGLASLAGVAVMIAFTVRAVGGDITGEYPRLNYPMASFAEDIRELGFDKGLIISDNRFLAGNMVLAFPESCAIIPGYRFAEKCRKQSQAKALIIWRTERGKKPSPGLVEFVSKTYGVDLRGMRHHYIDHLYTSSKKQKVTMAIAVSDFSPMDET